MSTKKPNKPVSVVIKKSNKPEKKIMAIFTLENGRKRTVHAGAAGMSDFPTHKDEERKARYLARHRKRENWNDPLTSGALARWILWNLPSRKASINDFKRRFNLK
jgi:hypothetical protein